MATRYNIEELLDGIGTKEQMELRGMWEKEIKPKLCDKLFARLKEMTATERLGTMLDINSYFKQIGLMQFGSTEIVAIDFLKENTSPTDLTKKRKRPTEQSSILEKKKRRSMMLKKHKIDPFKDLPPAGVSISLKGYFVAKSLNPNEIIIVIDSSELCKIISTDCTFDKTPLDLDGTLIQINNVTMKPSESSVSFNSYSRPIEYLFTKDSIINVLKKDENSSVAKKLFFNAFVSKYSLKDNATDESHDDHLEFVEQGNLNKDRCFVIKAQNLKNNQMIYLIVNGPLAFVAKEIFKFGHSILLRNAKLNGESILNGEKFPILGFDDCKTSLKIDQLIVDSSKTVITSLKQFKNLEKGKIFKCNIGFVVYSCLGNQLKIVDGKGACHAIYDNKKEKVSFEAEDQGRIEEASVMQGKVEGALKLCLHKVSKLDDAAGDVFDWNDPNLSMDLIY